MMMCKDECRGDVVMPRFVQRKTPRMGWGLLFLLFGSSAWAGDIRFPAEGHAESPSWSHDGKYLAFEVNNLADKVDLYISEVNGAVARDAKRVSLPGGSNPFAMSGSVLTQAVWHPEGVVVFEGSNQGGQMRLYYVVNGSTAASEYISVSNLGGDLTFPRISPDGNYLMFVSDMTGNGDIRSFERMTSKLGQVTQSSYSEMYPEFSANGKNVLFTRKRNNAEDVFTMPFAGGESRLVMGGPGDQTRPTYGEEGRVLFYDGARGEGKWDLVSVATSGEKKTIARTVRMPTRARPAISPDGEWVAYTYDDPTKADSVYVSRTDGTDTVMIASGFEACGEPAIGFQGGSIMLAYSALKSKGADWRFMHVEDITARLK